MEKKIQASKPPNLKGGEVKGEIYKNRSHGLFFEKCFICFPGNNDMRARFDSAIFVWLSMLVITHKKFFRKSKF